MRAHVTVHIAAPRDVVWAVLRDVERWPAWTASMTSVRHLDAGPLRTGSRVRIKQPRLPATTWVVTEVDEGASFTWVATAPGVTTTAVHEVLPTASGSVAALTLRQDGALGALIARATRGLTDRYLAMESEGLRREAERSAGRGMP